MRGGVAQGPVDDAAALLGLGAGGDHGDADAGGDEADDGLYEPDVVLDRAGGEAGLATDVEDLGVQAGHAVAGGQDEGLVAQAGDVDARAAGERVVLGQGDDERFVGDHGGGQGRVSKGR